MSPTLTEPDWYDRAPRWVRDIIDQSLHAALGLAVGSAAGWLSRIWLGSRWAALVAFCAACLAAIVYETVQNAGDRNNRVGDSVLDAAVIGVLGGGLAALILWRVA